METICFYHANCLDGFGSAHIVRNYYGGQHVCCVPVNYGDNWDEHLKQAEEYERIMFVDFCPPFDTLHHLSRWPGKEVIVLDHHKTAKETMFNELWPEHMQMVYNEELSGVGVTWDYFHPHRPMPMLYAYIQDRDLWKFELPNTKTVCAALFSVPQEHNLWNGFLREGATAQLAFEGMALQRQKTKDCEQLMSLARKMRVGGVDLLAVNAPWMYASELGHMLANWTDKQEELDVAKGVVCIYWIDAEQYNISLRSVDGAEVLARELAERHGGGGHDHAAGCKIKFDDLVQIYQDSPL